MAQDILEDKRKAEKQGYSCLLILVDIDESLAVKRNAERYRSVDTEFVKRSNKEFKRNIPILRGNFKHSIYINNSNTTDKDLEQYEKQIRSWAEGN